MGADKASVSYQGTSLAVRLLEVLGEVSTNVLVASGDGRRLVWLGAEQVADVLPDAGPLSGLVAGLERARTPLVAALAVDMPHASAEVLRLLVELWDGHDAVLPVTESGLEPLHGVYASAAAPRLRREMEGGQRSLRRALQGLDVRMVERAEWQAADPEGLFAWNLNRPEDLTGPP